jgi:hypothetical protein
VSHRPNEMAAHTGWSLVAVDDSAYRFACALLAACQVDLEVTAMIFNLLREGRIGLEQAIGRCRGWSRLKIVIAKGMLNASILTPIFSSIKYVGSDSSTGVSSGLLLGDSK